MMSFIARLAFAVGLPSASPTDVTMEWAAPASCPDVAAVQRRVDALLGDGGAAGRATVRVEAIADGFWAAIELETDVGATLRTVRGADCEAIVDAVALIVAVGLDPIAVAHALPDDEPVEPPVIRAAVSREPAPDGEPLEKIASRPVASPAIEHRARPDTRRRFGLGLAAFARGGASTGLLPEPVGIVDGGIALNIGSGRVEAAVHHGFARTFRHREAPTAGAAIDLTSGRIAGCWVPRPGGGAVRFPLCLGVEVGAYTARGRGLAQRGTVRGVWAAAVPELSAMWFPAKVFGFGVRAQIPISWTRPRFTIDDFAADLLQVGIVGARLLLAVELTLFDEDRTSRR
jgi:hypothetical protein